MTWTCSICNTTGFGTATELELLTRLDNYTRYLGEVCDNCNDKLHDEDYNIKITITQKVNP